jgi:hypothetical protein
MLFFMLIMLFCRPALKDNYCVLVRDDNDFATYYDSTAQIYAMPQIICDKTKEILRHHSDSIVAYEYQYAYRIKMDSLFLFLIKIAAANDVIYYMVAFDPSRQAITADPPHINGTWMENKEAGFRQKLLSYPLLKFADMDNDGINEIVIKSRLHNGSMYNAVCDNFYEISNNLALKRKMTIETNALHPYEDSCRINRILDYAKMSVNVYLLCEKTYYLGYFTVNNRNDSIILNKKPTNTENEDILMVLFLLLWSYSV